MTDFAFSATVDGLDLDNDEQVDALFAERFAIVPNEMDGVTSIDVEISAASGEEALQMLLTHLRSVPGVSVVRIDPDLVNIPEIAARLDVTRETVRLWAAGERGDGDFPRHRSAVGHQKVWAWADVHAWAAVHDRLSGGEPAPLDAACVDWINGQLVSASQSSRNEPTQATYFWLQRVVDVSWTHSQAQVVPRLIRRDDIGGVFAARSGASFEWSSAERRLDLILSTAGA